MKEKTYKSYKFSELSDEAKKKALDHFREDSFYGERAWEDTQMDAENIGLRLKGTHQDRMEGSFIEDACHCAHEILKNHGETCETYITAQAFLQTRDKAVEEAPRDESGELVSEYELDRLLDSIEDEFRLSILEDYRIMSERAQEDAYSDEQLSENIEANEYDFLEDGRRDI